MNEQNTILCMFSGGVDSTGAVWKLLNDSEYQKYKLHLHHINLVNKEGRALSESIAVKKIIDELERTGYYNRFTHTESVFDYSFLNFYDFPYFTKDACVVTFVAGKICNSRTDIRYVVTGRTKTDETTAQGRINTSRDIFTAIIGIKRHSKIPEFNIVVGEMEKEEIWNMLPENIRDLTAYCRKPIYTGSGIKRCKRCLTCRQMTEIKNANR